MQEIQEQQKKEKLKNTTVRFYLVLVLLILLVVATYTWFSISQTPSVSEMGMSIGSSTGLELAFEPNATEWGQYLDFRDILQDMAPLKPVTWSEKEQAFYAAQYGIDGRISGITQRLSDEANTNTTSINNYYMKNTCYARTGETVKVSLTPAAVGADGTQGAGTYVIGTPVWDSKNVKHNNGGSGAELALRVGILITKFDMESQERTGEQVFYIYEPNCDQHIDGSTEVVDTESIDGTDTLVASERLIKQTTSSWNETYPIQKNVVIRQLGEFLTDTELFELTPEEMAKIDIYVWLEGQDVDCTNAIGNQAQIFVNMQFNADAGSGSGIEKFE